VAVPTETVYGLAADAENPAADDRNRAERLLGTIGRALPCLGIADVELKGEHLPTRRGQFLDRRSETLGVDVDKGNSRAGRDQGAADAQPHARRSPGDESGFLCWP
jgi:hypothetical protein